MKLKHLQLGKGSHQSNVQRNVNGKADDSFIFTMDAEFIYVRVQTVHFIILELGYLNFLLFTRYLESDSFQELWV